ncbi:MAG: nuclear transport factor 2 family protein [Flavobacteriaceae bacterium]
MNTEIVKKFYEAFQEKDAETMVACYHDDIVFKDPAFGELKGDRAKNMWRMLCKNATDLTVGFTDITKQDNKVTAHWEAQYTFSQTGKKVHNIIQATFDFKDGKIIKHIDDFNLHTWAKQAMGFKGLLLGGTSFFQKKLQEKTNYLLSKFEF